MDDCINILDMARGVYKSTLDRITTILADIEIEYYNNLPNKRESIMFFRLDCKIKSTSEIISTINSALKQLEGLIEDVLKNTESTGVYDKHTVIILNEISTYQVLLLKQIVIYNKHLNVELNDLVIRLEPTDSYLLDSNIDPFECCDSE
jgi:hypothetical protein